MKKQFKSYRNVKQSKQGSSLLAAIIFLFIGFAVSAIVLMNAVHENRMVNAQVSMEQAHFAAEAGLEKAAAQIREGILSVDDLSDGGSVSGIAADGTFSYVITPGAYEEYSVLAEGVVNGVTRRVSVDRIRSSSFTDKLLFTEDFQGLWFIPGAVLDGKVHSDTVINLWADASGGPIFKEDVSTGADHFGGVGHESPFVTFEKDVLLESDQGSLEEIDFQKMELEAFSRTDGIVFAGRTLIDFDYHSGQGASSMIVSNEAYFGDTDFHRVDLDQKHLVYVKDSATESGTVEIGGYLNQGSSVDGIPLTNLGRVDGQLTIFTDDDVVIKDQILYRDNPLQTGVDSDDMLGVVSADDVWIDIPLPPASNDGYHYTHLFGAFLAAGVRHDDGTSDEFGNIGVVNYARIGVMGEMVTLGSQISEQVAAFGTFSRDSGNLLSGYKSVRTYDQRFGETPPPYFPGPQNLQFTGWSYARSN